MRLWIRYFREKRIVLLLYVLTAALFIAVGSLYHLENLEKLLYAGLLTLVVWLAAGVWQGIHYVRKSRQIERAFRYLDQSGELFFEEFAEKELRTAAEGIADAETYEGALKMLLVRFGEKHSDQEKRWEEGSAERRDYYLMWTHQIKTPISAMKLLLEGIGIRDRDCFLLKEELFKIEQYVEMVLTFQRLESISSDLVLQEYALDSLIRQAVKKYSVLFINRGLELKLKETEFRILTDEKWFIFCLEQILSNSIKYTARGGIDIGAEREETEQISLSIEDTGVGIRAEDLPRIFERGFTGYNGRLDKKSTGIGLYLCRQIFRHLGINVTVESEEGQGTKVTLKIPGAEAAEAF